MFIILIYVSFLILIFWCFWGCNRITYLIPGPIGFSFCYKHCKKNNLYLYRLGTSWNVFHGICFWTDLRQIGDVPSVDTHLLQPKRRSDYLLANVVTNRSFTNQQLVPGCSWGRTAYLCNFEELRDSCHSCEEFLVDIKSLFALDFLHVKIFLYQPQSTRLIFWRKFIPSD